MKIAIMTIRIANLLAEGERMPVFVHVIIGGDRAVWFGELDEPRTERQLRMRALDPEVVWLAHEHKPWRPRQGAIARAGVASSLRFKVRVAGKENSHEQIGATSFIPLEV